MANETYVEAYSEEDYLRDEQSFSNTEKENKVDWSAFSRLMTHDLLTNTNIIQDGCIGNVNIKDVHNALKHPQNGWRILLRVSDYLMLKSPHYYRLNTLYSNMALFCWGIDLYDVKDTANTKTIKKTYSALASKLSKTVPLSLP